MEAAWLCLLTSLRVGVRGPVLTLLCFLTDPSIGHRQSAEMPPLIDTSSPRVTQHVKVLTRTTSRPNTGTLESVLGFV